MDIVSGGRSIQADWIAFSTLTERGVASGNVRVADEDDTLQARFVEFNLETLEGVVFGADLDVGENDFLIRAEILHKVGDLTYSFKEATFTACRCPEGERLPWKLRVKDGEPHTGGLRHGGKTARWRSWAYPHCGSRGRCFPSRPSEKVACSSPLLGLEA